jgi:ABC-type multidrug transport system ATPase subunit
VSAPAGDPCLRISELTKSYGAIRALDRVSFDVRVGEVLGVIGPNGSGKTTLFECIGGVLPYDSGTIEPSSATPPPLFYLPDGIAPWPAQSVSFVLDFIAGYFAAPAGRRDLLIAALSLSPLMRQRIGELSKGQRKRVLLAIGLLTSRPIVLADEPFDGLDLKQTREVAEALRGIARGGRTLVLSIHQIADAARVCDRFVLLSGGQVKGIGTADELIRLGASSTLEEAFLALT